MVKKIASTFIIKVIIAMLNLAIVIVLSRFIGAAGKGEASLIVTTIAMILIFCNMIGGSSLVYFVPRYNTFLLFIISNLWSVIICIVSYFIFVNFPVIPSSFIIPVILLSLINSLLETNLTILLGKEKIMSNNIISLLKTVINCIILWLLLKSYHQTNINAYIYSLYSSMGSCLVISTLLILKYFKTISFTETKKLCYELVKLGFLNQAGHVMNFISFRISYYVLVKYSGEVILGVYSNGISLTESLLLISNSFATILYPKIANSNDKLFSQSLTLKMTKMSTLVCAISIVPLVLLPSEFWVFLFGNEFNGVRKVIFLLAPGIVFYNIVLIIGHYFSGTGNYKINTMANFIGLVITVTVSLIVIPSYGIMQAGIISTCSYIGIALFVMFYFAKESKVKFHHLLPGIADFKWLQGQIKLMLKQ